MIDYGRLQQHLHRQGRVLVVPPKPAPCTPTAWDPDSTGSAWDPAMAYIGFDASICDEARWIYSNAPGDSSFGICIIVYFDDSRWLMDFCVDTQVTETTADWDLGIEAPDHTTTPTTVAQWAKEHVQELLEGALKALLSGK